MTLPWPGTAEEASLWLQVLAAAALLAYAPDVLRGAPPAADAKPDVVERVTWAVGAFAAVAVAVAAGGTPAAIALAVLLALGVPALHLLRPWLRRPTWRAVWEVAAPLAFAAATAVAVGAGGLAARRPLLRLPAETTTIAAAALLLATTAFLVSGGARIVRAVLDDLGPLPAPPAPNPHVAAGVPHRTPARAIVSEEEERRRGRRIGMLERLAVLVFVLAGSYEAMGFLVAAKGLVRAREFEDRNFAEHFLIGTLTSTLTALAAALVVKMALARLGVLRP